MFRNMFHFISVPNYHEHVEEAHSGNLGSRRPEAAVLERGFLGDAVALAHVRWLTVSRSNKLSVERVCKRWSTQTSPSYTSFRSDFDDSSENVGSSENQF